ncbi:hypothetical protein FGO68_gene8927 [Halteria grandinella]|uniref:Uncharacterized protein n=1 Tax=Halteria grandinella TaxID=5974 RepID=A0A8J8SW13_HALGN|nr:hypothetical protein FGO68_gene8927 [Halteria grandinella]
MLKSMLLFVKKLVLSIIGGGAVILISGLIRLYCFCLIWCSRFQRPQPAQPPTPNMISKTPKSTSLFVTTCSTTLSSPVILSSLCVSIEKLNFCCIISFCLLLTRSFLLSSMHSRNKFSTSDLSLTSCACVVLTLELFFLILSILFCSLYIYGSLDMSQLRKNQSTFFSTFSLSQPLPNYSPTNSFTLYSMIES